MYIQTNTLAHTHANNKHKKIVIYVHVRIRNKKDWADFIRIKTVEQGAETHTGNSQIQETEVKRVLLVQCQAVLCSISQDSLSYKVQSFFKKAIRGNGKTAPSGKVLAAPTSGSEFESQNLFQKQNKQTGYHSTLKIPALGKQRQVDPWSMLA